jgi:hypothetical protein
VKAAKVDMLPGSPLSLQFSSMTTIDFASHVQTVTMNRLVPSPVQAIDRHLALVVPVLAPALAPVPVPVQAPYNMAKIETMRVERFLT